LLLAVLLVSLAALPAADGRARRRSEVPGVMPGEQRPAGETSGGETEMDNQLHADAPASQAAWWALAVSAGSLVVSVLSLTWSICMWRSQGRRNLGVDARSNEQNQIEVRVANQGRVAVYVQKAVLVYDLGGQELSVDITKQNDPERDSKLEVGGQSLLFRSNLSDYSRQLLGLGFQGNRHFPYIALESEAEELLRLGNGIVRPVLVQLLNLHEFNPPQPG
jgi:hypothetical protein